MKDPFEDFLEDALGGPDLELGHEMRRRLLEAAVAGKTLVDDNVVRIDRPDPAETAGFDWLVGEAPATEELMGRMIGDPTFMESLDGQRGFILTLREALRRTAAAAAVVPVRRRSWVPAAVLSAAAALAMTTGMVMFNRPVAAPAENLAAAEETVAPAKPAVPTPAGAIAATKVISPDATPVAPAPAPLIPGIAGASPPALADLGGTGRSIDPGDPALVPQLGTALERESEEESLPEPILAMLGGTDGPEEGMGGFGGDADSLALLAGGSSSWSEGGMNGFDRFGAAGTGAGVSLIGPGGGRDRESSIPEPGGALPVMIGLMLLMLRRPRREKARA
jgi:hypothetical protein